MAETRLPSDTTPIDRDELEKLMALARADTAVNCPVCGGEGPRTPPCTFCEGTGRVSPRRHAEWLESHNPNTFVTCPRCEGVGSTVQVEEEGVRYEGRSLPCALCVGGKQVRAGFAAAYVREIERGAEPPLRP